MSGFWYLATPYSKHPGGIEAAFQEAIAAAVTCIRAGVLVFSPIAHTHPIAIQGGLDGHFEQWADFDRAMISAAVGMIVVRMDGWRESAGISAELELCRVLGKPVRYMDAGGSAPSL